MNDSNVSRYSYVIEIMKQVKGFYGYLILSSMIRILSKLSSAAVGIVVAFFLGILIAGEIMTVKYMIIAVLTLIAVKIIISYLDTYVSHDMSFKILTRLREKVYDRIDKIAPGGLEGKATADFVTVVISDINVFEWFYAHILVEWIGTILFVIPLLIFALNYSVWAFFITLIGIIVMFIIPQLSVNKAEEKGFVMKRLFGRLNSIVADGVQGLKDIIGYHWENVFLSKLQETSEEYT
ncbi:MAG: hypothetical protein K2F60_03345, partial [Oscillospiraceae bacterium]|nr:hypothetical protein [Oscillospiraceae bacterium]